MNNLERELRALPMALETRSGENGQKTVAGHIPYSTESQVLRDMWGDSFVEELAPGCFDESMKTRDVVALWSHDTSQVLGNTRNGTLRLDSTEDRLSFDLDLPDTQAGRDSWESIQRRDVDGVSFGMRVTDDKWSAVRQDGQDIYKRTILAAELWEISPTVFAAYSDTKISCRSLARKEETKMADTIDTEVKTPETRTVPAVAITAKDPLEARKAFNHYLRTGEIRETPAVPGPIMVTGDGAALAPVDFAKEIVDGLADVAVMRQIARVLPAIWGKSAAYPRRTGGTGAAMVAEGEPIAPYDLTFDQIVITPKKAAGLVEVSNELLQDTGVDLAGYLALHFTDEIGELLEGQYWVGDGLGANLQGILTAEDADGDLLIKRVPTADTTPDVDDILSLWTALPAKYRKNAVFVCNSAMEVVLRGLKDGNGQYLMVPDLRTGLGNTLLGRPLYLAEGFPGDLKAGEDCLAVGDFQRAVFIGDKAGIDIQRNDATGFYKDITAFRAIFRTDVALAWPDALRVLAIKAAGGGT